MNSRIIPASIDYSNQLNPEQLQIVKEAEGPCLVLAGAGSGKTRVLVYRVCYLMERGVPPSSIMLVTFTNKAAREMIGRIERITGAYPGNLYAGTFHHVGNRLLRTYPEEVNIQPNFTILDEEDSCSLIKEIVGDLRNREDFPNPGKIKNVLSLSANTDESIKEVIETRTPVYSNLIPHIEMISREYQKRKNRSNLLDFDDILLYWHRLMKNENVGSKISGQFRYILVDEYHDTNRIQSMVLYQLARTHGNITAVGDDAQSIYSFRGATINNILDFPRMYPNARTFYLKTNYRSTPQILKLANSIISQNRLQFHKNLRSVRENGIKPVVVKCYYSRDEAAFVSQRILHLLESGIKPSDIGILFRSRYQSAQLEIEMNKLRIPYIMRGGLRFFEQAHIKDVLAFFRIMVNFNDRLAWKRLFSISPGIGEKTSGILLGKLDGAGNLKEYARLVESEKPSSRAKQSIENILTILESLREEDISSSIESLMTKFYMGYLEKQYKDFTERKEDIEMLKSISLSYGSLADFLSESSLQEYSRGEQSQSTERIPVILSTIHQAKGLEWKIVFVIGVSGNHFPHPYSRSDSKALEEERRIFYVAVTRAKEDIYISYHVRDIFGPLLNRKSVFIENIPGHVFEEWDFS